MKTEKLGMNARIFGMTINDFGWSQGQYAPTTPDVFGIEIELEGVGDEGLHFRAPKGWLHHADGSLRGGAEFVSNGPRTLEEVSNDLDVLNATFTKNDFVPVFSFRTSLHVHMNVGDLTHLQLLNMFALYTIFEQPMLEMGGEERVGNVHCLPVFLAPYPIDTLRNGLREPENKYADRGLDNALRMLMRNDQRYASFNWSSIAKFGTVEFRSHRGTADKDTVMRWVRLILCLKHKAKEYDNPQQIVQDFSRFGPAVFSHRTLSDEGLIALCAKDDKRLWEGLRNVQLFAFATNDWRVAPKKEPKVKTMITLGEAAGLGLNDVQWNPNAFVQRVVAEPARADLDWPEPNVGDGVQNRIQAQMAQIIADRARRRNQERDNN